MPGANQTKAIATSIARSEFDFIPAAKTVINAKATNATAPESESKTAITASTMNSCQTGGKTSSAFCTAATTAITIAEIGNAQ